MIYQYCDGCGVERDLLVEHDWLIVSRQSRHPKTGALEFKHERFCKKQCLANYLKGKGK